jgi:hypothetical protein
MLADFMLIDSPTDILVPMCECCTMAASSCSTTFPECVLLNEELLDKEFHGQIILRKAKFSKVEA